MRWRRHCAIQHKFLVVFWHQDVRWTAKIMSNLETIRHAVLFSVVHGVVVPGFKQRRLVLRTTSFLVFNLNLSTILGDRGNLRLGSWCFRLRLIAVFDVDDELINARILLYPTLLIYSTGVSFLSCKLRWIRASRILVLGLNRTLLRLIHNCGWTALSAGGEVVLSLHLLRIALISWRARRRTKRRAASHWRDGATAIQHWRSSIWSFTSLCGRRSVWMW